MTATVSHKAVLWSAYMVWWINSFIFEDGAEAAEARGGGGAAGKGSATPVRALHSYREMTAAHWDALFNLDANGVVCVLPAEDDSLDYGAGEAAPSASAPPPLPAKGKSMPKRDKKEGGNARGNGAGGAGGAGSRRTQARRYAKRVAPMLRDLFVAYMVFWSAMLFGNAGFGWQCQYTFEWLSPAVGNWANKTCKSDMQWAFQMAQGWKMFDRGIDSYDQWLTMPGQLADGRMGIDIITAW